MIAAQLARAAMSTGLSPGGCDRPDDRAGNLLLAEELRRSRTLPGQDLRLYIDGARLANAAAYLGLLLAELAECVDVLSFGGTKNGASARRLSSSCARSSRRTSVPAQAADAARIEDAVPAAQFLALTEDELWRRGAQHANEMARRLAEGVRDVPGVDVRFPVQSDAVFARVDPSGAAGPSARVDLLHLG